MARKPGSWQSERCTVCAHAKVGQINYALAKGVAPLAVARENGLRPSAVYNHHKAHVPETYKKVIGAGVYADLDKLLEACIKGDAESLDVLNAMISGHFHSWSLAFSNGSQAGMTSHTSQLRQPIELRAKINRELVPSPGSITNNIMLTGDVTTLLRILEPFPEAKAAIVAHYSARPEPKMIEHAAAD